MLKKELEQEVRILREKRNNLIEEKSKLKKELEDQKNARIRQALLLKRELLSIGIITEYTENDNKKCKGLEIRFNPNGKTTEISELYKLIFDTDVYIKRTFNFGGIL